MLFSPPGQCLEKVEASMLCKQTLMHKHLDFTDLMGCNVLASIIFTNTLSLVLVSGGAFMNSIHFLCIIWDQLGLTHHKYH